MGAKLGTWGELVKALRKQVEEAWQHRQVRGRHATLPSLLWLMRWCYSQMVLFACTALHVSIWGPLLRNAHGSRLCHGCCKVPCHYPLLRLLHAPQLHHEDQQQTGTFMRAPSSAQK